MIIVKSREEIELMRESLIVSKTLGMLAGEVKEGVTTLSNEAASFVTMVPNLLFFGLYGFPNSSMYESKCTSSSWIPNTPLVSGIFLLMRLHLKWVSR
jgi:methionyl aminopeptidase